MDDIFVVGDVFDDCLANLANALQRYKQCNLVLNWEKVHLMVIEGIALGHTISKGGIEVDLAKIEVNEILPPLVQLNV